MDKIKITERIHNKTIDFTDFMYQELSSIRYVRKGLNKSNKGTNDKYIDENINEIFKSLDDIYYYCIQKKIEVEHNNHKVLDLEIHTPSPRTPKSKPEESIPKRPIKINNKFKKNNIKVEITDDKQPNVLETIMYSSDDNSSSDSSYDKLSSDEKLVFAPNYKETDELVFIGLEEDAVTEIYEPAKVLNMTHCSWCKKNLPKDDVYKVVMSHKDFTTLACENCIERYKFVKIN